MACRGEIGDNGGKQAGEKGENRVQCRDGNDGDAGGDKAVFEGVDPDSLAMKRLTRLGIRTVFRHSLDRSLADRGLGAL